MNRELVNIAEDLKTGHAVEPVSVRTFLSWFGAQRRGFRIVHQIRAQLRKTGLVTIPDFESRWLDGPIEFRLRDAAREAEPVGGDAGTVAADDTMVAPNTRRKSVFFDTPRTG